MKLHRRFWIIVVLVLVIGTSGCGGVTPVPTPTNTPTKTPIPEPTSTPTPEPSPTATLVTVPTSSLSDPDAISLKNECRNIIDGLYSLKQDLGLPDHYTAENSVRQATDFDPNQYFQVFTHLKMKPGYTLDFIYFQDELGGKPLVYARKSNTAPFPTYEEFLKSYGEEMSGERSYAQLNHAFDYLEQVQIDKTPESYYEFVLLAFLGDQFYLQWHGLYNDSRVFCEPKDLQFVDEDMKDFDLEFPAEVNNSIEQIDFEPTILITDETVSVRIVAFTKWGGFWENIYVMDKENPLNLRDIQSNTLLEYDCGINF